MLLELLLERLDLALLLGDLAAELDSAQQILLEQLHQFRTVLKVDRRLARVRLVKHASYLLLETLILHLNQVLFLQRLLQLFIRVRLLSCFTFVVVPWLGHLVLGKLVRDLHLFELVGESSDFLVRLLQQLVVVTRFIVGCKVFSCRCVAVLGVELSRLQGAHYGIEGRRRLLLLQVHALVGHGLEEKLLCGTLYVSLARVEELAAVFLLFLQVLVLLVVGLLLLQLPRELLHSCIAKLFLFLRQDHIRTIFDHLRSPTATEMLQLLLLLVFLIPDALGGRPRG